MAKQGLEYYSMDVSFLSDIKTRKLMRKFGTNAVAVLVFLFSRIYGDEGYFLRWHEDYAFDVSDNLNIPQELVEEIVTEAVAVEFFDADKYEKYSILTSAGIQRRFAIATSRRKGVTMMRDYALWITTVDNLYDHIKIIDNRASSMGVKPETCIHDSTSTMEVKQEKEVSNESDDRIRQSKVKESKVKESRVEDGVEPDQKVSRLVSPKQEKEGVSESECLYKIPLKGEQFHPVTKKDIEGYAKVYSAIDIEYEIGKMVQWSNANERNKKTSSGVKRFVNSWLSRANDQAIASGRTRRMMPETYVKPDDDPLDWIS